VRDKKQEVSCGRFTYRLTWENSSEVPCAGPRGGGNTSPDAVQKLLRGGPFNAWIRSPDLGNRLQNVGEYIRYRTSLPLHLNELAILITAREWTSQKRPSAMSDDEVAVYEFSIQLHHTRNVDDATFNRALALFGERVWSI
jgi:4-carboxymuconolactone decarboxylase